MLGLPKIGAPEPLPVATGSCGCGSRLRGAYSWCRAPRPGHRSAGADPLDTGPSRSVAVTATAPVPCPGRTFARDSRRHRPLPRAGRVTLPIMLVAAAVCPCPPLLVPEVAAGAAPELDAARAACTDALGRAGRRPARPAGRRRARRAERAWAAPGGRARLRSAASAWLDARRPPGRPTTRAHGSRTGCCRRRSRSPPGCSRVRMVGRPRRGSRRRGTSRGRAVYRSRRGDRRPGRAGGAAGDGRRQRLPHAQGAGLPGRAGGGLRRGGRARAGRRPTWPRSRRWTRSWRTSSRRPAGRPGRCSRARPRARGSSGRLLYEDAPYGVGYLVAAWS